MHTLSLFLAYLGVVGATPFTLLSKRRLEDHQWTRNEKDGCPAYLEAGEFESPSYITQVSKCQPDRAFGPQSIGRITPNDVSSIFNFDIPASRADANCTLEFLFPRQKQLTNSYYKYHGGGSFLFTGYLAGSCPGPQTTYNNQPTAGTFPPFPPIHMEPGYAYTIDVGPCMFAAGTCVAGLTSSNDTTFEFLPSADDCPIGVYNAYSYGLPCPPEYCG
ncbi:ubiquitin 3 binding protein But2 C-terminal domain-containing protein [Daldinia caldariorum]|uniref:ubiquitin 3 binding protein But2 C-terminal domain-containing protein n=1 Tax=Daldinia caldariorum TaxID=326644 RepID=UPI002007C910|nr:ubiquitin 3 binding protein But2 C-terminal domain-containing protein [Daldinia caldariorum]KAI1464904.1 ubiquitin 3 binding protein But2 C-terminal domain-containing protein [Daldinia caldariorum]